MKEENEEISASGSEEDESITSESEASFDSVDECRTVSIATSSHNDGSSTPTSTTYTSLNSIASPSKRTILFSKSLFEVISEKTIASSSSQFPLETRQFSQTRLPKWKVTKFTPKVVKDVLQDLGFVLVSTGPAKLNTRRWIGYWGRHYSPNRFEKMRPWQIVNHFPSAFELGRKDNLWKNYIRSRDKYGAEEYDFIPESYILPLHYRRLRENFSSSKQWICKPTNGARGNGITIISSIDNVPAEKESIVSKYARDFNIQICFKALHHQQTKV
jgi:hypothetical protein